LLTLAGLTTAAGAEGVFARFQLVEPADAPWFAKVSGYIHNAPWRLPDAVWPTNADHEASLRVPAGQFSPWFDLGAHAGKRLQPIACSSGPRDSATNARQSGGGG